MQINADTSKLRKLYKELELAPKPVEREFRLEIERSAKAIETHNKRNARAHFKKGSLDKSISADSDNKWWTASIGSTELSSLFLEVGTKAHKIPKKPKPKEPWSGWLHFFWAAMGVDAHAMQVSHPGTPAFNLLLTAYIEVMEPFEETFGERLRLRLERLTL